MSQLAFISFYMSLFYLTAQSTRLIRGGKLGCLGAGVALLGWVGVGCATHPPLPAPTETDAALYVGDQIEIGDVLKVVFPGAPNFNLSQQVRLNGVLSLGPLGEVKVAGRTAKEVEADLLKIYGPELLTPEVAVVVESAGFPVFVSGAVMRPGRVLVNRSVTVVEALMEAGGYDPKRANLKRVKLIRQENGTQRTMIIDVESSLHAPKSRPFHLRPSDVMIVPEKFVFF